MIWGVNQDLLKRGRVKKFFTDETPDRKGGRGYGFLEPIDECDQRVRRQSDVFFMVRKGAAMGAGSLPHDLHWILPYHLVTPVRVPVKGDILVYLERSSVRGGNEVGLWVHESDYINAKAALNDLEAEETDRAADYEADLSKPCPGRCGLTIQDCYDECE